MREIKEELEREFEEFWQAYPPRNGKRLGKVATRNIFTRKQLHEKKFKELLTATKHYANSSLAKRGYIKDPERFLRNDYWKDWLSPETSIEDRAKQEAERERLKRELKQAYQDRVTCQGFLDNCDTDDSRHHDLSKRVTSLTRKIDILEEKIQ